MLSPALPSAGLWLLLLALPGGVAAAPESQQQALLSELSSLDAPWAALREQLAAESPGEPLLTESLSLPLASALSRARAAIARGEASPHSAGAGLAAVVRHSAAGAGARAADLLEIETALRELVPRLLADAGATAPILASEPAAPQSGDRHRVLAHPCAERPLPCEGLDGPERDGALARSLRAARVPGLPARIALDLHAELLPAAPEALR